MNLQTLMYPEGSVEILMQVITHPFEDVEAVFELGVLLSQPIQV